MEENQHQELSFEKLVEMANFDLDKPTTEPEIDLSLEQEEEEKPEVVEPVLEKPKEEEESPQITLEQKDTTNFAQYAKDRILSGDLDDVLVGEEGKEVKLSELEYIDEETYKAILEDDKKFKEEQFKSKYVSVENLSDTQKTLIEIIKSGDLDKAKELFENPQNLVEPFQGYDSDNEAHNEQVLRWFYAQQGNSQKEVDALIKVAKEDLTLDVKAEKIVDYQRQQFKAKLENEAKGLQEAKKQEQEKIKTYKKDLVKEFKESGILDDNVSKKYAEVATRYTKDGELEIDAIYQKLMEDPKTAKDVIHFLLDKKHYDSTISSAVKKEAEKGFLRKVSILRDTAKTTKSTEEPDTKPKSELENLTFD